MSLYPNTFFTSMILLENVSIASVFTLVFAVVVKCLSFLILVLLQEVIDLLSFILVSVVAVTVSIRLRYY